MNFFRRKKNFFMPVMMILLLPFFIIGLVLFGTDIVYGQLPGGAIGLFGGKLLGTIQCTCNGGHVMIIGPPRPARVRLVPGFTKVYPYGQTKREGAWQLGIYSKPIICLVRAGLFCIPVEHQGNIMIIGTSR